MNIVSTIYVDYYESRCLLKAKFDGVITVLIIYFGLNPDEQKMGVIVELVLTRALQSNVAKFATAS